MKGKSYNRAVRARKLVMEALFRIMWQVFLDWLKRSRREIEKDKVAEKRDVCKRALESRKRVPESVEELKSEMKEFLAIFNTFREEFSCKSHLFAFWNEYITMVLLLLQFLKAERTCGPYTPFFFAMDRQNYAKWLLIYLADMAALSSKHPLVHKKFLDGNHSVSRSNHPLSKVSTDMALKKSINRDSNSKGGIIGISQNRVA